jgi:SH3 domain-containing YSC84-like protein 1
MNIDSRKRTTIFAAILAIGAGILAASLPATVHAQLEDRRIDAEAHRVTSAAAVLADIMKRTERTIPRSLLDGAEAVAVFPRQLRIASRRGQGPITRRTARTLRADARGILSVRREGGTWSPPAFLELSGDSVPRDADLVLVVVEPRGLDNMLRHQFTIKGDAAVVPGPLVGGTAVWSAAPQKAEAFAYSRSSRGTLAGISLDGSIVRPDTLANQRYYGELLTSLRAIAQTSGPESVAVWRAELQKHSRVN